MKHPISTWTFEQVEQWRKKSACIGQSISYSFTPADRQQAIDKLKKLYPEGRVNPAFAERILYLSELY